MVSNIVYPNGGNDHVDKAHFDCLTRRVGYPNRHRARTKTLLQGIRKSRLWGLDQRPVTQPTGALSLDVYIPYTLVIVKLPIRAERGVKWWTLIDGS